MTYVIYILREDDIFCVLHEENFMHIALHEKSHQKDFCVVCEISHIVLHSHLMSHVKLLNIPPPKLFCQYTPAKKIAIPP